MLSSLNGSAMWPAGSDTGALGDITAASPDLWANFPKVIEATKALGAAVNIMADEAGKDLASLQAAIGGVGKVCGACHKSFRVEKK